LDNGEQVIIADLRSGVHVLRKWIAKCNEASDLETLCKGIMLALLAKIEEDSALSLLMLRDSVALVMPIAGYQSQLWAITVHNYGWRLYDANRHAEIDGMLENIMPELDSENFYSIVKSIDLRQFSLRARKKWNTMEIVLKKFLEGFERMPEEDRGNWAFSNDPILDLLEFLVVFYRDCKVDTAMTKVFLGKYEKYFDEVYDNLLQRMCLGFDIGVWGMSFARIRLEFVPKEDA
jgi:hypothetical protein